MDKIISVKDLVVSYGDNIILKGIDLDIYKNEILVLIGSSGGGKTTLLRSLNLLTEPTSGDIIYNNESIIKSQINLNLYRTKIGMVFQNYNLFTNLNVLNNLTLAPVKLKLMTKEEASKKASLLLKDMNLEGFENKKINALSGGQKQRVAIARTLMVDPEVILFDEPTSALDPEMVQDVLNSIKALKEKGITMVIVTHEMNFAKDIADKVIFIDKGLICEEGTPKEIFNNPKTERLQQFLLKTLSK